MGNSASVTVRNITLSVGAAAELLDQLSKIPEVQDEAERMAGLKRINIGTPVFCPKFHRWFTVADSDEEYCYGPYLPDGAGFCIRHEEAIILSPDEIATLNRIAARMGG